MVSDDEALCNEALCKIRAIARLSAEQTSSSRLPTWRRLFELARSLRAVDVPAEPDLLWFAASTWWEIVRPQQDPEDCFAELLRCYSRVLVPAGQTRLDVACQLAKTEPLPVDALRYPTPRAQRLVALCYWLHSLASPKLWFLSCRSAARAVGGSHVAAATLLRVLIRDGVLQVDQEGGPRATRYRYSGELRLTAAVYEIQALQRGQRGDLTERTERTEITEDNRRLLRKQIDTRARASVRARVAGPDGVERLAPAEAAAAAKAIVKAIRHTG